MSEIAKTVGKRLKDRRVKLGYSREKASELASVHPTYIGQLERGEKNVTIETLERVCIALKYPMDALFKDIISADIEVSVIHKCSTLIESQPVEEQEHLYQLIKQLIQYKQC